MGTPPTVVSVKKKELRRVYDGVDSFAAWAERDDAVYVGRSVRWVDGPTDTPWGNYGRRSPEDYCRHVVATQPQLLERLPALSGKHLGCWCVSAAEPRPPCHAFAIRKLHELAVLRGLDRAAIAAIVNAPDFRVLA